MKHVKQTDFKHSLAILCLALSSVTLDQLIAHSWRYASPTDFNLAPSDINLP